MVKIRVILETQVKELLTLKIMIKVLDKVRENYRCRSRSNSWSIYRRVKGRNYFEVNIKTHDFLSLI